ncbi:PREDICTED: elafin-like [Bison bison bison]|uniref:Elafin-like n=1 Tax=Bison bison bison TaxID=43346 RepID=A0A6P3HJI7_BISBB|nr:PREDICTED: elafin-like [Bison bison bison]
MKTTSFLVQMVVLLVLGTLVAQAAVLTVVAQDRARHPSKHGFCPRVPIHCNVWNPPNQCWRDAHCPGAKKCCKGFCGKTCMNPR